MAREDLVALCNDKFPNAHHIAVVKYEQDGKECVRYMMGFSEPVDKNGNIKTAEADILQRLKVVAPKAEFIEYAVIN
jgi:hypothetical protein